MKYGECTVQWIQGAKVDGRVCTCIQVVHPVPRRNFLFHLARIYVDDELQLPIRYEAYDWPARAGEPPQLTEEYTFLKVKVNNGFTDADFSVENPAYGFK
jgi:outer membrane lipoprotein-sorting protein